MILEMISMINSQGMAMHLWQVPWTTAGLGILRVRWLTIDRCVGCKTWRWKTFSSSECMMELESPQQLSTPKLIIHMQWAASHALQKRSFQSVDERLLICGWVCLIVSSRTKLRPGTSPVPWSESVMLSHGVLSLKVGGEKVVAENQSGHSLFSAVAGRLHFSRKWIFEESWAGRGMSYMNKCYRESSEQQKLFKKIKKD